MSCQKHSPDAMAALCILCEVDRRRWMLDRIARLEEEVRELRALVTPLDPGTPAPKEGTER